MLKFLIFINVCRGGDNAILKTSGTLIMKNNGASVANVFIIKFDGKPRETAKRPSRVRGKYLVFLSLRALISVFGDV